MKTKPRKLKPARLATVKLEFDQLQLARLRDVIVEETAPITELLNTVEQKARDRAVSNANHIASINNRLNAVEKVVVDLFNMKPRKPTLLTRLRAWWSAR